MLPLADMPLPMFSKAETQIGTMRTKKREKHLDKKRISRGGEETMKWKRSSKE